MVLGVLVRTPLTHTVSHGPAFTAILCCSSGTLGAGLERVLSVTSLQRTPAGPQLQRSGTFITFASVMFKLCVNFIVGQSVLYMSVLYIHVYSACV